MLLPCIPLGIQKLCKQAREYVREIHTSGKGHSEFPQLQTQRSQQNFLNNAGTSEIMFSTCAYLDGNY